MFIGTKRERINKDLINLFSNEKLISDRFRFSKILSEDLERIRKLAFDYDIDKYYKKIFKKVIYHNNYQKQLDFLIHCAINSCLWATNRFKEQMDERELYEYKKLEDIYSLLIYLGQSESDDFLHDEETIINEEYED